MSSRVYDPSVIEPKWQRWWDENHANEVELDNPERPFYVLMMFPYPSAEGLHIGNVYAYTGADIQGRWRRMCGYDVLQPMGFDAFGIHSENHALKEGTHPFDLIPRNVANFTRQFKSMGFMLDWRMAERVDTTSPDYYRWTQWIFVQLYKAGLAVRKEAPVTWCPECKTVVSDEFVDADGCCDRHPGTKVEKRTMTQWFFRISQYAQQLLDNLEWLDWSDSTKKMQVDWIGRSEGAEVDFTVDGRPDVRIRVFTTRPDTLFGATYMVLAPEHPLVEELTTDEYREAVDAYREQAAAKSEIDRAAEAHEKTGTLIGSRATNPVTGESLPIFIADYVMMGYGTGAIMAVPAHDTRDFEFAKAFGLPIRCILDPDVEGGMSQVALDAATRERLATTEGRRAFREDVLAGEACWTGPGRAINSTNGDLDINGLPVDEAKERTTQWLSERGLGEHKVNFRVRDWCISRQRYWGPPIPMIHCDACGVVPVPEQDLPVLLPRIADFRPLGTGVSPLAAAEDWVNVACPKCGASARRETDVSDNFLDSAWYFLRYPSAEDDTQPYTAGRTRTWLPVDHYIGGNEHARLHLLYTRFINMALCDCAGLVMAVKQDRPDQREPFLKFTAHGMITRDGAKMSKSRGNVINPDEFVGKFGADAVRMYLMFVGPYAQGGDWRDQGIVGMRRFLERAHAFYFGGPLIDDAAMSTVVVVKLHQTIRKVSGDIEGLSYNTAIAALMECLTALRDSPATSSFARESFCKLLAPFAPHLAQEIWAEALGHADAIADADWPEYDEALATEDTVEIAVQVNGKLRATVRMPRDSEEGAVREAAVGLERVQAHIQGKQITKVIQVPNRILNLIVR